MKNENGNQWRYVPKDNSGWYSTHKITEKDVLWMEKNFEVSRRIDFKVFQEMINSDEWEDYFIDKDTINLFSLDLYDPNSFKEKMDYISKIGAGPKVEGFGFCHDMENLEGKNTIEDCDERFGKNHFIDCCKESDYEKGLKQLLELNNIEYFDIIECSLILKDTENPFKVLTLLQSYLNLKAALSLSGN